MWTFGKKLALGFAIPVIMLMAIGTVAHRSTDSLASTSAWVSHTHKVLERISTLEQLIVQIEGAHRGYALGGDDSFLEPARSGEGELGRVIGELRKLAADNPTQQRHLDDLAPLLATKVDWSQKLSATRRAQGIQAAADMAATQRGLDLMSQIHRISNEMQRAERVLLEERELAAKDTAEGSKSTILYGTLLCLLMSVAAGYVLTRSLTLQIGSAVRHIQSSSAELQAAANQQVAGTREQTTAMNEISTTINELLATSRQISDSAQRVAQIAGDAGGSARKGDHTVQRTQETVMAIKRQVDVIVGHMLDLGKKSQQIGSVLDIINELSEQTNILAINATIEAAGAGESGRRFSVVADEIRKLADRVGGSTKEIRNLVDDIRAAVNTTVMATEVGSKAVDAGTTQFSEVTTTFKQIAGLVQTTSEAAREIELSTKQQTTAVEQVNLAVANVSQAAKETESSSNQTLQTASEMTKLSRDLTRMIQPDATS